MDKFNKIYLIGIIILCIIILTVYIQTVHGAETNNQKYCSLGQRDNCINIIPQNEPIHIDMIVRLK